MLADFKFSFDSPIVCTAIHNGHDVSKEVAKNLAVSEETRLREEDPFTDRFALLSSNSIMGRTSRFEVDLNRTINNCIYLEPNDAWGLQVRKNKVSKQVIAQSQASYIDFYDLVKNQFTQMEKKFGKFFVFDFHSYNHQRQGEQADFDDPSLNPEINIGTNNMPEKWFHLIQKIQENLTSFDYFGRNLDVRQNVKFPGGHFSRWIHNNFPESACCIAIEIKKFWMNEWTGIIDESKLNKLIETFKSTLPLIESEILKCK